MSPILINKSTFSALNNQKKDSKASLIESENGNAYAVENGVEKQPIVENKGQE